MLVLKSRDATDEKIYYYDGEIEIETPDGLVEAAMIYHTTPVDDKSKADYTIKDKGGKPLHFKFTSNAGLEAFKTLGKKMFKSTDVNAVTSPNCLIFLGRDDLLVEIEVEPDIEENNGDDKPE